MLKVIFLVSERVLSVSKTATAVMETVYSVPEGMEVRRNVPRVASAWCFTASSFFTWHRHSRHIKFIKCQNPQTLLSFDWIEILKALSLLFPSGGTHWRRALVVLTLGKEVMKFL